MYFVVIFPISKFICLKVKIFLSSSVFALPILLLSCRKSCSRLISNKGIISSSPPVCIFFIVYLPVTIWSSWQPWSSCGSDNMQSRARSCDRIVFAVKKNSNCSLSHYPPSFCPHAAIFPSHSKNYYYISWILETGYQLVKHSSIMSNSHSSRNQTLPILLTETLCIEIDCCTSLFSISCRTVPESAKIIPHPLSLLVRFYK